MNEEKKTDYHQFCEQWTRELMENPSVQDYCKVYQKYSMESFCNAYANIKASGLKWGEMYQKLNDQKQNEWIDAAFEHLSIIQQKKLFDAQCLWRAEQLGSLLLIACKRIDSFFFSSGVSFCTKPKIT